MTPADLLVDALGRVRSAASAAVDGLPDDALTARPAPGANTIAWLVWHLARVQDDHLTEAAGTEQVWTADGWSGRFALDLPDDATGYGFDDAQVDAVRASAELLTGYLDAVTERSLAWVRTLTPEDLERVVDRSYDPPVTLGARLVSVVQDDLMHAGQATYARGLVAS